MDVDLATPPGGLGPAEETVFGKFLLKRLIARGGMAEVHLAVEKTAHAGDRLVVLKRILPAYKDDPDYVEFFKHEARVALQLVHPNIVQAYEFGQSDHVHYLSMEYVRGCTALELLRRAAQRGRHLSLDAVCKIAVDVAAGLDHVHHACDPSGQPLKIVHRDVSPHNIIVAREGLAKLVDFGIARATTQEFRTRTGVIKGKFAYLAPEQLKRGSSFDHRADLWALGVVLYELLTRRPLFRGSSDADTVRRIFGGRIPPLRELRKDCPAALEAVVHKALERDLDRRYQTGAALLADLEEAARASGIFPTMTRLRAEIDALHDDGGATAVWNSGRPVPRATPAQPGPPRAGSAPSSPSAPASPPVSPPLEAGPGSPRPSQTIQPPSPTPVTAIDPLASQALQVRGEPPAPLPVQPRLSSPSFGQVFAEPIPDEQLEYFLRLASARRSRADTIGMPALTEAERGELALFDELIEPEQELHDDADPELMRLLDAADGPRAAEPAKPAAAPIALPLPAPPLPLPAPPLPLPAPPETPAPGLMRARAASPGHNRALGRRSGAIPALVQLPPSASAPTPARAISDSGTPEPMPLARAKRRRLRWFVVGAAAIVATATALAWLVSS